MKVIFNSCLPTRRRVHFPRKGPYFQRRLKRTASNPRNWEQATFLMAGSSIYVHPAEWPQLKQALINAGVYV